MSGRLIGVLLGLGFMLAAPVAWAQDTNGDGFISASEAAAAKGKAVQAPAPALPRAPLRESLGTHDGPTPAQETLKRQEWESERQRHILQQRGK